MYSFIGNFTSLNAGLATAGRNTAELGTKLTALDKNGAKMRAGLSTLGSTAGKVGLVAAAGLGAAVLTAAKFDKAMSSVQAATHETAGNMEDLRAAAIKAGADTAYSASEAAGAIEELAKAGVSTSDILDGGLSGSLNLAAAGAIDVADAAELAATAMTQFKLGGDQVNHVADLLASGAGHAQGSVDDLGMALKQGGLVASQTGLSIEETVGTLSAFASAGLIGSDAGTSFKTMLQSLTPSSVKAKEEMERLGISAYDAQGNFIGMTEFAGQLQGALSTLTVEQQNAALKTIFGSDAVRAASVIYDQGADGIQDWIDKTNDSGYAAETAGIRMDNLAGDFEKLKGSLETALIGAGDGSQAPLRGLVQGLDDAVNGFNDLSPAAQGAVTKMLGITAITGGGLWFGTKVISGIVNTKQALSDLGFTASTTNGKIKGLAAAGGGIVVLTAALIGAAEAIERLNGGFDTSSLDRDFEALAGGDATENMESLVDSLETLRKAGSVPALADLSGEITTLFGALGNSNIDQASEDIKALDEYLAELVESGNAEVAAEHFDALVAGLAELNHTNPEAVLDDVTEMLGQYGIALDNAGDATVDWAAWAGLAGGELANLGPAGRKAAGGIDAAGDSAEKAAEKLKKAQDAARETARGFITLGDSLSDGKKSLGQWTRELEQQAQALRDFTANARTAAKRGLDDGLIKSLNEAGPAGALRMKQLANATDEEIKRANKAWREGQAAIREYVNMQVPKKKIEVDTGAAMTALRSLRATYDSFRDKSVHISVTTSTNATIGDIAANAGRKHSVGGYTGDGGVNEPAGIVHRGEVVIPQSLVKRDWGMLSSRYGFLPGFAGGGVVGSTYARTSSNLPDAADAAANSLFNLAGLGKRELEIRSRLLNKEVERDQKAADAARDHRNAVLDDMKSLKESIANRFKSDVFGQQRSSDFTLDMPESFESAADAQAWFAAQQQVRTAQESAGPSPIEILKADIAKAREARQLYRQLRQAGLSGSALTYAQQNASNEELSALLGDPKTLRQFQRLYGTREQVAGNAGQTAAMQRYGNALDRANGHLADMKVELHQSTQALHDLEKRQRRMEHLAEKNPQETGDAVADAVNGAAHAGRKGRVPA